MSEDELYNRAVAAYYRFISSAEGIKQQFPDDNLRRLDRAVAAFSRVASSAEAHPDHNLSGVVDHEGKQYVVLRNVSGLLSIYRVRNDGMLKRLKRWPAVLEN